MAEPAEPEAQREIRNLPDDLPVLYPSRIEMAQFSQVWQDGMTRDVLIVVHGFVDLDPARPGSVGIPLPKDFIPYLTIMLQNQLYDNAVAQSLLLMDPAEAAEADGGEGGEGGEDGGRGGGGGDGPGGGTPGPDAVREGDPTDGD